MNRIDWYEVGAFLLAALAVALVAGGAIGWVLNLVALAKMDYTAIGMLVLRVVGVFVAPIGAVLGYVS